MIVTKHAKQRIKQRCGVGKKSADRMAKIAYENGIKHKELTGNLKKWVDGLYLKHIEYVNKLIKNYETLFLGDLRIEDTELYADIEKMLERAK